jgi:hypothetical protein
MKRGFVLPVIALFLISFASAYGSYSSFSLSDMLNEIDSATMILGGLFIIFFALSNFALVRAFKGNKAVAGVVSFVVSLFAIYGINKTGFDFEGLFYGFGISENLLYTVLPIVLLVGTIILIWKIGVGLTFIALGGLLILITVFTELIYENGIAMIFGVGLFFAGLWLWRRAKRKEAGLYDGYGGLKNLPSFSTILKILLFIGVIYIYLTTSNLVMTGFALLLLLILLFFARKKQPSEGPGILRRGAGKAWEKRPRYDWEKEKEQAKAIGRGIGKGVGTVGKGVRKGTWGATKGVAKGTKWAGEKAYGKISPEDKRELRKQEKQRKKELKKREKRQALTEKAHEEALRENERRKKEAEAKQLKQRIKAIHEINDQINTIKRNIREYENAGRTAATEGERTQITGEILRLKDMLRQLESQKRKI